MTGAAGPLQAVKCRVGLHKWGAWKYQAGAESGSRECCQSERLCTCCGATQLREGDLHDWSEWAYISDDDCTRKRDCRRCGAEAKGALLHRWSEWEESPALCQQKRECHTCQASESKALHQWEHGKPGEGRFCSRCHMKDERSGFEECTDAGICDVCNAAFPAGGGYRVPVRVFYKCDKYREWLASRPESFAINIAGGAENLLMQEASCDGRKDCTVCKRCVEMFCDNNR